MELQTALRLALDPSRPDVISVVGGGGKSSAVFRIALDLARYGTRAVITHTARIAAFQTEWAPAVVEVLHDTLPYANLMRALDAYGTCLLTGPVVGDRRAGLPPDLVDELAAAADKLGIRAITVEADGSKMRPAKAPAEHEPVLPHATTLLVPVLGLDAIGGVINSRLFHRAELVRQVLSLPPESVAAVRDATDTAADPEDPAVRLTPRQAAALLIHRAGGAKARPPAARLLPMFNKADHPLRLVTGRLAARSLVEQGQASLLTAVGSTAGEPVVERWGPIAVVILAAGAATRFGAPKQLAEVNGRPMLVSALATAAALGGPVYVVIGAHAEAVESLLADLPTPLLQQLTGRLHIVKNTAWAYGQASSLHVSVRSLGSEVEAAIWMPVDQPFLQTELLAQLAAAWRRGANLAAPAVQGEMRGAPALFDRTHWPELLEVAGDSGGRSILRRHADQVTLIAASGATLRDIDMPADLT
jgi:molybdenum cofactor cytidylyltransferase